MVTPRASSIRRTGWARARANPSVISSAMLRRLSWVPSGFADVLQDTAEQVSWSDPGIASVRGVAGGDLEGVLMSR